MVEIALKDISVRLERDASTSNCWKVVFCDLAQLQGCELTVGAVMNLRDAASKLEKQIESLDDVWNQLEDIDRYITPFITYLTPSITSKRHI